MYPIVYHLIILLKCLLCQLDQNWLIYAKKKSKHILWANMQKLVVFSCNEVIVNALQISKCMYPIVYHLRILFHAFYFNWTKIKGVMLKKSQNIFYEQICKKWLFFMLWSHCKCVTNFQVHVSNYISPENFFKMHFLSIGLTLTKLFCISPANSLHQLDQNWLSYAKKKSKHILWANMQKMVVFSCNEVIVNVLLFLQVHVSDCISPENSFKMLLMSIGPKLTKLC
jgi:hypothetical protein